ncbi:hypothetical protein [Haloferax elongans]|uniref:hypothetical protein n=1 Tax=Haloferax elongans TaxID=403191 RepID=UPI000B00B42B|nr:hypothetical protein [Haloferax elongans]
MQTVNWDVVIVLLYSLFLGIIYYMNHGIISPFNSVKIRAYFRIWSPTNIFRRARQGIKTPNPIVKNFAILLSYSLIVGFVVLIWKPVNLVPGEAILRFLSGPLDLDSLQWTAPILGVVIKIIYDLVTDDSNNRLRNTINSGYFVITGMFIVIGFLVLGVSVPYYSQAAEQISNIASTAILVIISPTVITVLIGLIRRPPTKEKKTYRQAEKALYNTIHQKRHLKRVCELVESDKLATDCSHEAVSISKSELSTNSFAIDLSLNSYQELIEKDGVVSVEWNTFPNDEMKYNPEPAATIQFDSDNISKKEIEHLTSDVIKQGRVQPSIDSYDIFEQRITEIRNNILLSMDRNDISNVVRQIGYIEQLSVNCCEQCAIWELSESEQVKLFKPIVGAIDALKDAESDIVTTKIDSVLLKLLTCSKEHDLDGVENQLAKLTDAQNT